ncbi:MAG: FRG domain-containing protein [Kiritimatiellae bacterium]|nr:FRG domain-containing protein [Kiritimatiellia bacterium]
MKAESLVLMVTIVSNSGRTLDDWKTLISANIMRHMEMRFNKGRFAGKSTVDLIDMDEEMREKIARAQQKTGQIAAIQCEFVEFVVIRPGQERLAEERMVVQGALRLLCNTRRVVLVLRSTSTQDKPPTSDDADAWSGTDEHRIIIGIQRATQFPCAVEFFRVCPGEKHDAAVRAGKIEAGDPDRVAEDLYHLASRVCGAFTEYLSVCTSEFAKAHQDQSQIPWLDAAQQQFFWHEQVGDIVIGRCSRHSKNSVSCHSICPYDITDVPGLADELRTDTVQVHEAEGVPKILDVRDAISLVCEGLDGSMHFFPPVPRGMQQIFKGEDNDNRVVAARYKFPFGVWFRGQARVCFDIVPSLFQESQSRPVHPECQKQMCERTMYDEATMIHHFMAQKPLLRHDYLDHFEWLCLMQHHGAPTRVLDWTENILIALYFAVCDVTADCDGVVWVLNAGRLNEITRVSSSRRYVCLANSTDVILRSVMAVSRTGAEFRRTLEKIGKLREIVHAVDDPSFWKWTRGEDTSRESSTWRKLAAPVAVFPTRVNQREADQLATFTICGGKQYDEEVTSIEKKDRFPPPLDLVELSRWRADPPPPKKTENDIKMPDEVGPTVPWIPTGKPFLQAFVVPSCAKRKLREQLKRLGVHVGALFPELEHQTKYIRHQWRFEYEQLIEAASVSPRT